jgi:predicted O-methyltransferase YrrM
MFNYPNHFIYPKNETIWFNDHIEKWNTFFPFMKEKPNVCLEIGAYHGASSVYIAENFCKNDNSHLYIMDINESEHFKSNISSYKNVTFIKGESRDSFKYFNHNGVNKEFLDFVYIDGSHMSCHVLEDAINSFYCLKNGGIIIFDDYLGGLEQEPHLQVKLGVDAFMSAFHKHLILFMNDYQIGFIKKWNFTNDDLEKNYYNNSN